MAASDLREIHSSSPSISTATPPYIHRPFPNPIHRGVLTVISPSAYRSPIRGSWSLFVSLPGRGEQSAAANVVQAGQRYQQTRQRRRAPRPAKNPA